MNRDMNWLSSPLAATVVVCAVLAALAMPLRKLTTGRVVAAVPVAVLANDAHGRDHVHEFRGILRVRLLADAASLHVRTTDGKMLWDAANLEAGEHEVDVDLRLVDDALELLIEASFNELAGDTALFLTVLPDGVEEITHYAIGSGRIEEVLHYEWDLH
ncbi:MAG: hypothetical protein ACNA8L_01730 [Luteolibacter sp.]|jgi:hypothetical protein